MSHPIPYIDYGGAGPLLHFAHANAYTPGCYRLFLTSLLPHYHIFAGKHRPLWPGSDPREIDDWHPIAEDMLRLLDQVNAEEVIGVGHSLGGVATMYAALAQPERFRAVVLVEPVFLPPQILETLQANRETALQGIPQVQTALNRRNRWQSRDEAFRRFRQKSVFQRLPDEALWDYVNHAIRYDAEEDVYKLAYRREWEARFYALLPSDVWDLVGELEPSTLAIRGAESGTIYPEAWTAWQERQPDATFVEVPETGHLVPMERPFHLADLIHNWLQDLIKDDQSHDA